VKKIFVTIITLCALTTSACTTAKHVGSVVKADAIECAKQDLGQTVVDAGLSLAYTVAGIIFQGGTDWQADLDKLAATYGPDALACAAKIAGDLFTPPTAGSGAGPSTADALAGPSTRAKQALEKFAHGREVK
jgi:hypothetical protein